MRNPNDSLLLQRIQDLEALFRANPLRSASVERGRVRMYGESELLIEGLFSLIGHAVIMGDIDVLAGGQIRVGGVVITPLGGGRIEIGTGARQIVIDSATQRITIGTGDEQIVLDPSQFRVGPAFRMDPAHSSTGAELEFGIDGDATIYGDDESIQIQLGNVIAALRLMSNVGPLGTGPGVAIEGKIYAPDVDPLPPSQPATYLVLGNDGVVYKTSGVGGGGGSGPGPIAGSFMYPFDPSTTDAALGYFGMRLNPVTGIWTLHAGQDFSVPAGSPIPAAGDGVIKTVAFDSGRGNYVVIDHGNGIETHYFHMPSLSPVAVGTAVERGDIIGSVGTTGNSTGPHLHWETHVDGSAIDPREFMATQSE